MPQGGMPAGMPPGI